MTKRLQVYKCEICGNIVEVVHAGPGQLVCCGRAMILMKEKKEDKGVEKHLPVAEATQQGIKVKVGSIPHPMEDEHYIEWIEVLEACGNVQRKFLAPGESPEAVFDVCCDVEETRSYCNLHGHWGSKETDASGSHSHTCG